MIEPQAERKARTLRVAAIQMPSENGCIAENLTHATPLIAQASKQGAQLILLPEFMPTGYFLGEAIWDAGEPRNGPTVRWLKESSQKLGAWIGTSFLEADGRDFYNTFILTDPSGAEAGRVRKRTPATWEAYFFRGQSGSHAIQTTLGRVGVGICFDNQKADVAAALSRESVDIVLMPHSYPVPERSSGMFRKERMVAVVESLGPLYASLLGVPVVLANKCGPWVSPVPGPQLVKTVGSFFPGLSAIIDSDGSIKARLAGDEGILVADVTADPARKKHPVPPRYGRYVTPGSKGRVMLRLIEAMGQLSYALNSTRKKRAAALSSPG